MSEGKKPSGKRVNRTQVKKSKRLSSIRKIVEESSVRKPLELWAIESEKDRLNWLNKPRLHTAVFEQLRRDEEIEKALAAHRASFKDSGDAEKFASQKEKRQKEVDAITRSLNWSPERLSRFMDAVIAYRKSATIQNYLSIRREFPEVEIEVGEFGGLDALFSLEGDFRKQGIEPDLIAGALDGVEPRVDKLCLRLLELLAERDNLPKSGPGSIQLRRSAISSVAVNYLIVTILEAYDWSEDTSRIPASLVVLIRHQLCGTNPDLEKEYRSRERKKNVAIGIAQFLEPGEQLSINRLKSFAGVPRTTAARWLNDPSFKRWLDFARGRPWEALSKSKQGLKTAWSAFRECCPTK